MRTKILVLSLCSVLSFASDIDDYKLSLQHQTQLNQAIRQGIKSLRDQESGAINKLRKIESQINIKLRQLVKLDKNITKLQSQKRKLQNNLDKINATIKTEKTGLIKQVQFFYIVKQQNIAKIIFSNLDKSQTSKISAWYQYLAQQRIKALDTLKLKIAQQKLLQQDVSQKQVVILQAINQQSTTLNKLRQYQANNKYLLVSIRKDLKSDLKLLQQGEADYKVLQFMIDKLTGIMRKLNIVTNNIVAFKNLRGRLNFPSKFKYILSGKSLIFQAINGSEVTAIATGRVIFSDWMRGYGLLTIIDHGDGYMSLYGRNKVLFKDRGEWISQGEVIAQVGDTGGIVGSGLFFELRHNNQAIATKSWFNKS